MIEIFGPKLNFFGTPYNTVMIDTPFFWKVLNLPTLLTPSNTVMIDIFGTKLNFFGKFLNRPTLLTPSNTVMIDILGPKLIFWKVLNQNILLNPPPILS